MTITDHLPRGSGRIRLDQAAELVSFQGSPATEPLYTINPFMEVGLGALFVTHPPVGERVRRLRELDPDWREAARVTMISENSHAIAAV